MFRFTSKPSSGNHSQYLAKIPHLVQCGYIEVVQTSVLWLHSMTCEACVLCTHASQVILCSVVCISWTLKCLISLMHGVTMKTYKTVYTAAC
jgi:hypothetical protein